MATSTTTGNDRQIAGVETSVATDGVVARFEIGGQPIDAQRQGAFARAMAGTLEGIAGRWSFDDSVVVVRAVRPDHAGDVSSAIEASVGSANEYLSTLAAEGQARHAAQVEDDQRLEGEAVGAVKTMRAQLGL
jgi:hypothetical protein